ncbi:alpha/beta fold hydrolase [Streptomyces qinzhouensis]|uniref:alpha/beta fold hydrolase n=1 Tax=Streptomyces qinzhouensis TaxID=2599401 RepID=UPI00164610BF|nr:alpha/beta fold hydrolase [Streptomyces qinzhouensis]
MPSNPPSPISDHRGEQPGPAGGARRRRALAVSALVLAGLQTSTGLAAAQDSARPARTGLDWQLCATATPDWPIKNDTRTECAELSVPMDYAKPGGRKITIAVSRVKATDRKTSEAPIVFSLGGPGTYNITNSATMTQRGLATLNTNRDFIGLDIRGSGYSDRIDCVDKPFAEPAPTAPEKSFKKAEFDHQAEFNNRCAAIDPEFVRQITPENAARDIDRLRTALGTEKLSFHGASFGTAVGLAYRSLFDHRTERMWLDSVMPPKRHWPTMDTEMEAPGKADFAPFVTWLTKRDAEYHLGTDDSTVRQRLGDLRSELEKKPRTGGGVRLSGNWVIDQALRPQEEWDEAAKNLVAVRNGGTPATPPAAASEPTTPRPFGLGNPRTGFNNLQYNAMLCNTATASRGFGELWTAREARRTADPMTGGTQFTTWCAQWPLNAPPAKSTHGKSALQLSGHLYEGVTPYVWAEQARDATGGTLLTIPDKGHASVPETPCAAEKAITFFRTGRQAGGTCTDGQQP